MLYMYHLQIIKYINILITETQKKELLLILKCGYLIINLYIYDRTITKNKNKYYESAKNQVCNFIVDDNHT